MKRLIHLAELHNRVNIFANRTEAGRLLGHRLRHLADPNLLVLAIPAGGVPVGIEIANRLRCPLDLLVAKKIELPWNAEAGFGAINPDGDIILNEPLLQDLNLNANEVQWRIKTTRELLAKRLRLYRHKTPEPELKDRTVILADDGLASGYTMLISLRYVRKRSPARIIIAVPTGMSDTVESLCQEADSLVCLNIRDSYPFAVAAAYKEWYDLTDAEVLQYLNPGPTRSAKRSHDH